MGTVTVNKTFRRGFKRFQDVLVDCASLRREVKEEGYKFNNIADYLIKYHHFRHFDIVTGSGLRRDGAWWIRIRRKGLVERIFNPSPDGTVWEDKRHGPAVAAH